LMQYFSFIFRSSMGLTEFHLLFCSLKWNANLFLLRYSHIHVRWFSQG
jgi:hypothetical protein